MLINSNFAERPPPRNKVQIPTLQVHLPISSSLQIQISPPANSNIIIFEFAEMIFEFAGRMILANKLAILEFATLLRGGGRSVKVEFTNTSDYGVAIFRLQIQFKYHHICICRDDI